jgi:hypothetical protein
MAPSRFPETPKEDGVLPTPQDLAQLADTSRLPALDHLIATIPAAALVFLVVACVAVAWLCWSEWHQHAPGLTHRRV